MPKVDIKEYAKYLLKEGSRDEKREILGCLKTKLYLKNQKVYLKNKRTLLCQSEKRDLLRLLRSKLIYQNKRVIL